MKIVALTIALLALSATRAHAVPEQLGLTARVTDDGTPLTGDHAFEVRIFAAATGGASVWTEAHDATVTDDGLVYLTLGDQTALDADLLDGGPLWVELQVDDTVLSPRLAVTSAAYAIRAGVAEDAERLGGQDASAFAAANHDHAGTYLPVGATLACTGTQKVTAINANGSVTCGADVDTDTDTTGITGGTCPAGQKVSAVSTAGVLTCTADLDTDTNTTYSAGAGLTLTGTSFSPTFAGTGTAATSARSDHTHPGTCPVGFSTYTSGQTKICIRWTAPSVAPTYYAAAKACLVDGGQNLCRHEQVLRVRQIDSTFGVNGNYWLGDKMGDNTASYTNNAVGTNAKIDDIDGVSDVGDPKNGYYCCLERTWF